MGKYEKYADQEDEYDVDSDFENKYDKLFGDAQGADGDFDRDVVTGRKSKRPKMSILNKSRVSKQELDELFLEH